MTAARCGTASGYKRHQRARERPCDACVAAKAAYDTRWRATTPAGRLNRLRARAQARALGELRRRHPAEYRDIYEPLVAQILTDEPVDTEDPS